MNETEDWQPDNNENPPSNVAATLYSIFLVIIAVTVISTIIYHVCKQDTSSQVQPISAEHQQTNQQQQLAS